MTKVYLPIRILMLLLAVLFMTFISAQIRAAEGDNDVTLATKETPIGSADIQSIPSTLKASPDGKRLAFIARHGNSWMVIADGVLGKEYDGIGERSLIFSPDSKQLAYAGLRGNDWVLVVNDVEQSAYDGIRDLIFSPDSKRVAYFASRGNDWSAVVDNVAGKKYDECCEIAFSPDSKHLAYSANRGRTWSVVVDGIEGKFHDFNYGVGFSPDGQRIAYVAQHGNNWSVVVDGIEGKEYDAIGKSGRINPDARRAAYTALKLDPQGTSSDDILGERGPVFSPDSQHIAYWARRGNSWHIVVDGLESKGYDGYIRGSNLVFDNASSLHGLAIQGQDAIRVNIDLNEKK